MSVIMITWKGKTNNVIRQHVRTFVGEERETPLDFYLSLILEGGNSSVKVFKIDTIICECKEMYYQLNQNKFEMREKK